MFDEPIQFPSDQSCHWSWELATNRLEADGNFRAILGVTDGQPLELDNWLRRVAVPDRDALLAALNLGRARGMFAARFRLQRVDGPFAGREISAFARGEVLATLEGAELMVGVLSLVESARESSGLKLLDENALKFALIDSVLILLDPYGHVTEVEAANEGLLYLPAAQQIGQFISDCLPISFGISVAEMVRTAAELASRQDLEGSYVDLDGLRRTFAVRVLTRKEDGYMVVLRDITEFQWSPSKPSQWERLAARTSSAMPGILFLYDLADRRTTYANPGFREVLGYTEIEVMQMEPNVVERTMHPHDRKSFAQGLNALVKRNNDLPRESTYRFLAQSGEYRWLLVRSVIFQRNAQGVPRQILSTALDVTAQKEVEAKLEAQMAQLHQTREELEIANRNLAALARSDGLTGLHNQRSFHSQLTAEVARAHRYGTPLSLVLADLDHFKAYNDAHGHPAGDELLRRFAGVLVQACRSSDVVARQGGEEFALILPYASLEEAQRLAERIRAVTNETSLGATVVTASFGVASLAAGQDKGGLISEADKALYRAKASGRNQVCG